MSKKNVKTVVVFGYFITREGDRRAIFESAEFGPKCHYQTAHELVWEMRDMHRKMGWQDWAITDVVIG